MALIAEHSFLLRMAAPARELTGAEIEALGAAGCTDMGIDTGVRGTVFDVSRTASSRETAVRSAVSDIRVVLPDADLRAENI